MRRVNALALVAALGVTTPFAKEIFLEQDAVTRHNFRITAEALVHRGKPVLSLRIVATDLREQPLPGGGKDLVRVTETGTGLAFLPITVACDRMVLEHAGTIHRPLAESLCNDSATLPAAQSMPIFVAFPLPQSKDVRTARLVLPITVARPAPRVQRALREEPRDMPRVEESLLGPQTLTATVYLR